MTDSPDSPDDRLALLRAELSVARNSLPYVPEQEIPFVRERITELRELIAQAEGRDTRPDEG